MSHKILVLNNGALSVLISNLNSPGWCKDIYDIYCSGKLLSRLPEPSSREGEFRVWANKTDCAAFEITDKELECCIKSVKYAIEKATPSPWLCDLLDQLGIAPCP
jgi:hypothetical protein